MAIVFYIPFVLALLILLIFMVFYPRYYKQKINRDLQQGKPIKVIEPIYLYGGLMFVILIGSIILTNTSISNLEKRFNTNINSKITSLEFDQQRLLEEFWDLEETINQIKIEDDYLQMIDINVTARSSEEDMFDVLFDFVLTENVNEQNVSLVFEHDGDIQRVDLTKDTRQQITQSIALHTDYVIYVEVEDNGVITTHDFLDFNLYEYLKNRFSLYVDFDTITNNNVIIQYNLINQWENHDHTDIKIAQVDVMIIFNDETLIEEVYQTPNILSSHYQEFMNEYTFELESSSGTWQILITVTDEYGIVYTNLLY